MKKKEINYYKNEMITETKETQTLKNYIDLILNYKIKKSMGRKISYTTNRKLKRSKILCKCLS